LAVIATSKIRKVIASKFVDRFFNFAKEITETASNIA
jgi:hypothetical protein